MLKNRTDSRVSRLVLRAIPTIAGAVLLLHGCGGSGGMDAGASGSVGAREMRPLIVTAPHVLKKSLSEINKLFMRNHAGARIRLEVGIVDETVKSIRDGTCSGDILLMMDGPEMRLIEQSGVVRSELKTPIAAVQTIVAVPKGNPKDVKTLEDLLRPEVGVIAFPDPAKDSSGAAFAAALKERGMWEQVQEKAMVASSPHTACTLAEEGVADVGVTYMPCVLFGHSEMTLSLGTILPRSASTNTSFVAMPYANSSHPLIQTYIDFLLTATSQAVFGSVALEPVKPPSPENAEQTLLVPCGAGLQAAMDVIGETYFRRHGIRVDFNYAGSGMLLAYLNFSRRGDLYIPGESFYIDLAAERDFIRERKSVACFLPVIVVQRGNPRGITGIADLARPGLRVAIGDPEALAVGPVTQRILNRAGIAEAVEKNVTMKAGCIPELANAMSMRTADAAIVWDAIAYQHRKHIDVVDISTDINEAADVVLATLSCSKQPETARHFLEFVASAEGAALFRQHGFRTDRPAGVRLAVSAGHGWGDSR